MTSSAGARKTRGGPDRGPKPASHRGPDASASREDDPGPNGAPGVDEQLFDCLGTPPGEGDRISVKRGGSPGDRSDGRIEKKKWSRGIGRLFRCREARRQAMVQPGWRGGPPRRERTGKQAQRRGAACPTDPDQLP